MEDNNINRIKAKEEIIQRKDNLLVIEKVMEIQSLSKENHPNMHSNSINHPINNENSNNENSNEKNNFYENSHTTKSKINLVDADEEDENKLASSNNITENKTFQNNENSSEIKQTLEKCNLESKENKSQPNKTPKENTIPSPFRINEANNNIFNEGKDIYFNTNIKEIKKPEPIKLTAPNTVIPKNINSAKNNPTITSKAKKEIPQQNKKIDYNFEEEDDFHDLFDKLGSKNNK